MGYFYLIGSLRNPEVPKIAAKLRSAGFDIFDSWFAGGPIADDSWKAYEEGKGLSLSDALKDHAAQHVFQFDFKHLNECHGAVLVLPAGVSGHLELGYVLGQNKRGFVLLPAGNEGKLPPEWRWLAGLFEGEGSITCHKAHGKYYPRLSIAMTDRDVLERVVEITGVAHVRGPYVGRTRSLGKKPIYYWQPGKLEDIVRIVRGIWSDLRARRRDQVVRVLTKCGVGDDFQTQGKPPYEFRWDVMYNFATGVVSSVEELIVAMEMPYVQKQNEAPKIVSITAKNPPAAMADYCLSCGQLILGDTAKHARCR